MSMRRSGGIKILTAKPSSSAATTHGHSVLVLGWCTL
jgi:hypothetical protein